MEYDEVRNGDDFLEYAVELKNTINESKKLAKDSGASITSLTKNKELNKYLKALPTTVTDPDSKVAKIIVAFAEMVKTFKEAGAEGLLRQLFEEANSIYDADLPVEALALVEAGTAEAVGDYARNNRVTTKYQKELSDLAEEADQYDIVPKAGWLKYFNIYYQKQAGKDVSQKVSDLCADIIIQKDDLDEISSSIESLR